MVDSQIMILDSFFMHALKNSKFLLQGLILNQQLIQNLFITFLHLVKFRVENFRKFWRQALRDVEVADVDGLEIIMGLGDEDLLAQLIDFFEVIDAQLCLRVFQIFYFVESLCQILLELFVFLFELLKV